MKSYFLLWFVINMQYFYTMEHGALLLEWVVTNYIESQLNSFQNKEKIVTLEHLIQPFKRDFNAANNVLKQHRSALVSSYFIQFEKGINSQDITSACMIAMYLLYLRGCFFINTSISRKAIEKYKKFLDTCVAYVYPEYSTAHSYMGHCNLYYFNHFAIIAFSYFSKLPFQRKYEECQKAQFLCDLFLFHCVEHIRNNEKEWHEGERINFGYFMKQILKEPKKMNKLEAWGICNQDNDNEVKGEEVKKSCVAVVAQLLYRVQSLLSPCYYFRLLELWNDLSIEKFPLLPEWIINTGRCYGVDFLIEKSNDDPSKFFLKALVKTISFENMQVPFDTIILSSEVHMI